MSTPPLRFPLAVVFQRTPLANRWVSERWEPVAIEPDGAPAPTVPVRIADDATGTRWRFGGHSAELHPVEAEGYHLNLTAPEPKVFVMWRRAEAGMEPAVFPVVVTLSYNEAARMLDGGEQVDALPLPPELRVWMEPFVTANYVPEVRGKMRRNDPFPDRKNRGGRGPAG